MDLNVIRKLVKIVELSTISDLEIEEGQSRIKISKSSGSTGFTAHHHASVGMPSASQVSDSAAPVVVPAVVDVPAVTDTLAENIFEVRSPIVGTFYQSPSPDADAYTKVGDKVVPGQVLCIVEAMKLMNEIESEVSGTVVKIVVENGRPIEYNQVLFLIQLDN